MATNGSYISPFQIDPLHPIQLQREGRVGPLRNLEPCCLYRIVFIDWICIALMASFLIHIRKYPSDILSEVYV